MAGRLVLVSAFMSAHMAFGTPRLMATCKTQTTNEEWAPKNNLQELSKVQARKIFNLLPSNLQRMVSELSDHLSKQFRNFGLFEDANTTTNFIVVGMLYEIQNDPSVAGFVAEPSTLRRLFDAVANELGTQINICQNNWERQELQRRQYRILVLSNFFGKLSEYPSSQYLDLLDRIKRGGDAEIGRY